MGDDEMTDYDDAVIEDTVTCRCCGASYDVSEITVYGGDVNICEECEDREMGDLLLEVVRLREMGAPEAQRLRTLVDVALDALGRAENLASENAEMAPMLSEDATAWADVLSLIREGIRTLEHCAPLPELEGATNGR